MKTFQFSTAQFSIAYASISLFFIIGSVFLNVLINKFPKRKAFSLMLKVFTVGFLLVPVFLFSSNPLFVLFACQIVYFFIGVNAPLLTHSLMQSANGNNIALSGVYNFLIVFGINLGLFLSWLITQFNFVYIPVLFFIAYLVAAALSMVHFLHLDQE